MHVWEVVFLPATSPVQSRRCCHIYRSRHQPCTLGCQSRGGSTCPCRQDCRSPLASTHPVGSKNVEIMLSTEWKRTRSWQDSGYRGLCSLYLVIRVSHHRGLPLSVHVFIPVIRLLSVRVWDSLWLVPVLQEVQTCKHMKKLTHMEWWKQLERRTDLWLLIIRVRNLFPVVPVLRLFGFGVLNSFGGQEVPVLLQTARLNFLIINLDLIRVVWVDNQRVQVAVLIVLEILEERFRIWI